MAYYSQLKGKERRKIMLRKKGKKEGSIFYVETGCPPLVSK